MLQKAIRGWCRRSYVSKAELARRMDVDRALLQEANECRLLRNARAMAALHRETGIPYDVALGDIERMWKKEERDGEFRHR